MTKKSPGTVSFLIRLTQAERDHLEVIKQRDGIPVVQQIRRALDLWFQRDELLTREKPPRRPVRRRAAKGGA